MIDLSKVITQTVHCLDCDDTYGEHNGVFIPICPHCGNSNTEQTVYLENYPKEGDLVIANDDLNIVNDCIGEIRSIDKSNNGEKIYTVKFDTGTFLLKENQIGGIE